jgi:hypothetical protein
MNKKYLITIGLVVIAVVVAAQQTSLRSMENGWQVWKTHSGASFPAQVACSANGEIVYLVVRADEAPWVAKLLKSTDGGKTWEHIKP